MRSRRAWANSFAKASRRERISASVIVEDPELLVEPPSSVFTALQDKLDMVKGFIIYCDEDEMPQTKLNNVHCYETLINEQDGDFSWRI